MLQLEATEISGSCDHSLCPCVSLCVLSELYLGVLIYRLQH